jgi:AraC-like DNA-binding protein
VLDGVGLGRAAFANEDTFVPALVIYQLCEDAAIAAGDETFLALLGEAVNTAAWPPMVSASEAATDLAQLLTRFAIEATEHSSALTQSLSVQGKYAVFSGRRSFKPSFVPAQIDGFFAGLMVSVLRRALGTKWNPQSVIVTVSDPKALPRFFFGIKAIRGDRQGYRLAFPAQWLTNSFDNSDFQERSNDDVARGFPARTAAAAVKQALTPYIGEYPMTSKYAADICGKSERALSRMLAKEGTSLGKTITHLKKDYAVKMLRETDVPILDIAHSLGYTVPTSFTRSFKDWLGQTPRDFRRDVK